MSATHPDSSVLSTQPMRPLVVIVSGPPGSGKSTLAQRLAGQDALWLPLLSVDALKQGLAVTQGINLATDPDALHAISVAAVRAFLAGIDHCVRSGISVIAEFSFRRDLAARDLPPLLPVARVVNVHCALDAAEAQRRFIARERAREGPVRGAATVIDQMEQGLFDWSAFDPPPLGVPLLRVDTTRHYTPDFPDIVTFCWTAAPNDA